jgi:hypothetical protein
MLSPVAQHVLVPDYSLTTDELFVKASGYLLLSEDRIDPLYASFELLRSPGIPSWALNFARSLPLLAQQYYNDMILPDKTRNPLRRPAVCGRILRTSGVILDRLDEVISTEDASSDIEKMGLIWRAQGLLCCRQPVEPLPEGAKICIPTDCLLPLNLALPGRPRAAGPLHGPVTVWIPGFATFCLGVASTMASALTAAAYWPANLRCHNWKDAHRLPRTIAELGERLNPLLVQSAGDPESFYGGACFDLDNLKAKIRGVTYRGNHDANPQSAASLGGGEAGPQAVNRTPVEDTTSPIQGEYVPQYAHITSILGKATSEHEFQTFQAYLVAMADCGRKIFEGQGPNMELHNADPLALRVIASIAPQQYWGRVASYREILENCTCDGAGERDKHRWLMQGLIDTVEDVREHMQPGWDQTAAALAAAIHPDCWLRASKVAQSYSRDICGVFTTRHGFSGSTFQRRSCLEKEDVLAVLDGMPAPVVLEEVLGAHSTSYRMKALVHVHGMNGVDIDRLTELGVCVRKEFDIV